MPKPYTRWRVRPIITDHGKRLYIGGVDPFVQDFITSGADAYALAQQILAMVTPQDIAEAQARRDRNS